MKKKGFPRQGELVIVNVVNINPNSLLVKLLEYDAEGMIHISEVSSGWVRDIRRFVKLGQESVAKVIKTGEGLSLSLKRVTVQEKTNKLKEYKLEQRATKMLEMAGSNIEKKQEEIEKKGIELIEIFGSIYEVFKLSLLNPQRIENQIEKEWLDAITDVARKNIVQKEFELKAKLFLKTYDENGIEKIKNSMKLAENMQLEVKYIAAPVYLIKYKTKNPKKGSKELIEKLNKITEGFEEARFEILSS